MSLPKRIPFPVEECLVISSEDYDGIVLVTDSLSKLTGSLEELKNPLQNQKQIDDSVEEEGAVVSVSLPAKRIIFSPTGPLNRDYDDVRRFSDAAKQGMKRALAAGVKKPMLVRAPDTSFENADLVTVLGALEALYVPLEMREDVPEKATKVEKLGVWGADSSTLQKVLKLATALEISRSVARDIGGSDPERMTPPRVEEYVQEIFSGSAVKMNVISDRSTLQKEYPLFAAVDRCASVIERHCGRIINLSYEGQGPITQTLFLVGKGVTYDTGGADIKAGGVMAGMSRDKCGSAAVAGFFQALAILKPKGIKVIGAMAMVRNSVGANCYVADEIITSRAGVRVRVGNTDAEGRMAMGDALYKMKELAVNEVNANIMTLATLTGHAVLTVGAGYSIILDNGPAQKDKTAQHMQEVGHEVGDPFEVSSIRREDYKFHGVKTEYADVLQCNNLPSSRTPRGHQTPSAFLILASGLDKHGIDSSKPLKYSHLDIAPSAGNLPDIPTGAPVVAMAMNFLKDRI